MLGFVGHIVYDSSPPIKYSWRRPCKTSADQTWTHRAHVERKSLRYLATVSWAGMASIVIGFLIGWATEGRLLGVAPDSSVTHGVIQCSTLGPVLFLLFTNDVASYVTCDKIVMYADDSQFLNSSSKNDLASHKLKLEDMLSTVQNWYDHNSLKLNPTKTEMMIFGIPKQASSGDITVNFAGAQVRPVTKMKVLGFTLDPELRWEDHVSTVIRKSYATLAGLAKFAGKLPTTVKSLLSRHWSSHTPCTALLCDYNTFWSRQTCWEGTAWQMAFGDQEARFNGRQN